VTDPSASEAATSIVIVAGATKASLLVGEEMEITGG